MTIDKTKLTQAAADQAADLDRQFAGQDREIGRVCTVVEILGGPEGPVTAIHSPEGVRQPAPILDLLRQAISALQRIERQGNRGG